MTTMLRNLTLLLVSLGTLALAACKFSGTYTKGRETVSVSGEVDPRSGEQADSDAKPLGKGTITMDETGETFEGEFFDTDGDGKPDKFKPEKGQTSGGMKGETNGTDWYDVDPK